MPIFSYTGLDSANKYDKGTLQAKTKKKALAQLEKRGLLVISISQVKRNQILKFLKSSSVKRLDKILFTRHLHTLLDSGIALDESLKISSEQTTSPKFTKVLLDLHEKVKKGQTFSSALSAHPNYFSSFYTNLVKVGESSGTLDDVLYHLLEQQEQDYELITKTRGAMIYPAVIITAAILIVILMMAFVIPSITGLLLEYGVDLPLSTKILIFLSNAILHYGVVIFSLLILLFYAFYRWIKKPQGKLFWDSLKLKIPIFKSIVVEFNLARFARSMSTLLKSGVGIDDALELTAKITGNMHYQNSLTSGIGIVRKGVPLTQVLNGYPKLYPAITTRMIEVGEKTGKMDNMFTRLALFYEKSVLNTITNLSSVIEPVLLLFIGLGVGFIAVSILTPIWKFAQTI